VVDDRYRVDGHAPDADDVECHHLLALLFGAAQTLLDTDHPTSITAASASSSGAGLAAQAVERGMEDRLEVAGLTGDRGDGDDHVEDLLEREVPADLAGALRSGQQRRR